MSKKMVSVSLLQPGQCASRRAVHSLQIGCAGARYLVSIPQKGFKRLKRYTTSKLYEKLTRLRNTTRHCGTDLPKLDSVKPSEYMQTNKQPLIPHPRRSPFYGLPHPPPLTPSKAIQATKTYKTIIENPHTLFRSLIIELLLDSLPYHSQTTHLEQCLMLESRLVCAKGDAYGGDS
jgi:hypothetical protein